MDYGSEGWWNDGGTLKFENLIISLKHPNLLRHCIGNIKNITAILHNFGSFRAAKITYLKIAISILMSKILATSKKIVIKIGGIQYPGKQFLPKKVNQCFAAKTKFRCRILPSSPQVSISPA